MRGAKPERTDRARTLRSFPTDAERRLWSCLRNRQLAGAKFVRQEPIGPYVVDFICREHRLVIEADGGQHAESLSDQERDTFLRSRRYKVLRFWNNDILRDLEGVCLMIEAALAEAPPHPNPLPASGERGNMGE
ncbi:MAG: endonuclease domain-containing protein [Variibacter sp.]|nr:endonuclease domain-containing protein [Variibacter sp.]